MTSIFLLYSFVFLKLTVWGLVRDPRLNLEVSSGVAKAVVENARPRIQVQRTHCRAPKRVEALPNPTFISDFSVT